MKTVLETLICRWQRPRFRSLLRAWGDLAQVGMNVVTYKDLTVTEGGTYCYRVKAYNAAGASAWSNTAGITVPLGMPTAPSQLGVVVGP